MKEWGDGDIDKAMREAAGNFAPKYNTAAWAQMQSAMQAEGLIVPVQSPLISILKYLGIGILLLLLLVSGIYFFQSGLSREEDSSMVEKTEQPRETSTSPLQSDEDHTIGGVNSTDGISEENSDRHVVNPMTTTIPTNTKERHSDPLIAQAEMGAGPEGTQNSRPPVSIAPDPEDLAKNPAHLPNEPASQIEEESSNPVYPKATEEIVDSPTLTKASEDTSLNDAYEVLPDDGESVRQSSFLAEYPAEIIIVENQSEEESELLSLNTVEKKQYDSIFVAPIVFSPEFVLVPEPEPSHQEDLVDLAQRFKRWSASLIFSPDFSGASIGKLKGTGIDAGLIVEYFISRNLSVNSGAIYSTKKYFVDDGFSGYTSRWPNRDQPDEIDASCSVIDIPVNLKYYLRNNPGTRIFVSAGVSSYFMLSEDYTYLYDNYAVDDWTVSLTNENTHYFGLLNFSFGIQKEIKNGLYIVGEPYYKSPLTGIGAGGVSLKSTGFIISVKKDF